LRTMRWAALSLLAAACSSGGAPGTPAPGGAGLAYSMPTSGALHYDVADTAIVTMDVMGQSVQVTVQSQAVIGLSLDRAGAGLAGTLTFESLSGEATNTMGPGMTVSDADKPGPTSLTIDPRGAITVTARPEMSSTLQQVLGSESYVHRMFVRLPGRAVTPGTSWTDTVSISEPTAGMSTSVRTVVTSTLRGDTMVAGARLLVIDSKLATQQKVSGTNQGVEIQQTITGNTTAVTLWDPARGVLVERRESGALTGSMDLPAMGMSGLPLNVRQSQIVRLRR